MRIRQLLAFAAIAALVSALAGPSAVAGQATGTAVSGCGLTGDFRIYSARIDYSAGGAGVMPPTTRRLALAGGRWRFGSSSGRFRVAAIAAADWSRWGVESYGPTRKVVFSGWKGATATGPIEGTAAKLNFFWLIYPARPPAVQAPGVVSLKFGHAIVPRAC